MVGAGVELLRAGDVQVHRGLALVFRGPAILSVSWKSVLETNISVTIPRLQSTIMAHHSGNFS